MDKGQLSRRLRGDYDLKLETLSDLARGLECRIDVRLIPLSEVVATKQPIKAKSVDEKNQIVTAKPTDTEEQSQTTVAITGDAKTKTADDITTANPKSKANGGVTLSAVAA